MILLIGSSNDPHLIAIQRELNEINQKSIILDTSKEALLNTEFSYYSESDVFLIKQNNAILKSSEIRVVFCLSPLYARKGFISSNEKDFWHFTWRESLFGFYDFLSERVFWTNSNLRTALSAQSKISFFAKARKSGLNTPDSLISNNKDEINSFFIKHPDIVLKTMHQIYLEYSGKQAMLLVNSVSKYQFEQFETKNECPVFLQEKIDKKFDIRAIIIGSEVIGCKIDASKSSIGNLDWRVYDLPNTKHSKYEFTKEFQLKLVNVIKLFGLDYACLDLCVDDNDNIWLLDVNPFGKYMWIELAVGLNISKSIANFLGRKVNEK
ncbi:hypothetical protein NYR60_07175 [Actinobacillus genomosp. 2]|uniref:ATP-grasp domain-containing protein n=1 Tax=Actinobacillus genomosp. 2 TaxID=230709 RepID=UPI00244242B3|nr:hypothetical protein [Actinobacillus genomosp. 2]WGE31639.1 hypothetical protein NYR60_07175 [Actinobacillus genomosp. 2]